MAVPKSVRAFISLELPDEVKQDIHRLQEKLSLSGGDVNWVRISGLHLTLKFLGQIPADGVSAITSALDPLVSREHRLLAGFAGVGTFPRALNPRVIWIGIEGGDRLLHLQRDIEQVITGLGFEPESRPFIPHLTIGRVRSPRGRTGLVRALEQEISYETKRCELSDVCLMKSERGSGGAVYTTLWVKSLAQ